MMCQEELVMSWQDCVFARSPLHTALCSHEERNIDEVVHADEVESAVVMSGSGRADRSMKSHENVGDCVCNFCRQTGRTVKGSS